MQKSAWSRCGLGFILAALVTLATLLVPSFAFAGGSVIAKSTQLDEADGKWKLELTIDLGSVPDIEIVPMNFVFTPTAYDEFACDEQHPKPFHNLKPLVNQSPITVPQDVSFADTMGKVHKNTKMPFSLHRDDRFEAGEYTLEVQKDGKTIGGKMSITLKGENRVVDRRPMTFAGDNRKHTDDPCQPKNETASASDTKPPSGDDPNKGSDSGSSANKGGSGDSDGSKDPNASSGQVPPEKGCKCSAAGLTTGDVEGGALMAAFGFVALGYRRRRRAA